MSIVFYGTPSHPTLGLLYQEVRRRHHDVVFVTQEEFPWRPLFRLTVGETVPFGYFEIDGRKLAVDDITTLCMDGFYISNDCLAALPVDDIEYARTECWATLLALFGQVRKTGRVINDLARRDVLSTRYSQLLYLRSAGFQVPDGLVTSDPQAAREFVARHKGLVISKPVSAATEFRMFGADDLERIERVALSPVHFEEVPTGKVVSAVVVGDQVYTVPGDSIVPADVLARCSAACRSLGLWVAEVSLREQNGRWLASGLRSFAAPEVIAVPTILDAVVTFIEARVEVAVS